jgi:signal peptidase I
LKNRPHGPLSICACAAAQLRRNFRRVAVVSLVAPGMANEMVQPDNSSWLRTIFIGRNPRRTAVRLLIIVIIILLLRAYVLLPIRVDGPSMLPNYRENSINVINRLAYLSHEPRRGDVVAIRFSAVSRLSGNSIMLMKRVVGLPGETVEFKDGRLFINGQFLEEPYLKYSCNWEFKPDRWQLGDDEYYVVGDNRTMPHEDHKQGSARRERIVGKVML